MHGRNSWFFGYIIPFSVLSVVIPKILNFPLVDLIRLFGRWLLAVAWILIGECDEVLLKYLIFFIYNSNPPIVWTHSIAPWLWKWLRGHAGILQYILVKRISIVI